MNLHIKSTALLFTILLGPAQPIHPMQSKKAKIFELPETKQESPIFKLDKYVLRHIENFLDWKDLLNLRATCQKWRKRPIDPEKILPLQGTHEKIIKKIQLIESQKRLEQNKFDIDICNNNNNQIEQQNNNPSLSYTQLKNLIAFFVASPERVKRILRLYLFNNNLIELPPEIGQLKNLKTLDLEMNMLTELPSEIGQLRDLQELILNENMLLELPPEIEQLRNLEELYLNENYLTTKEIANISSYQNIQQSLQFFSLGMNILSELPPEIGQLRNLQELQLWGNNLSTLPQEIEQLNKLEILGLANNSRFTEFPIAIKQLRNLQELQHNSLTPEAQEEIKNALPNTNVSFSMQTYNAP